SPSTPHARARRREQCTPSAEAPPLATLVRSLLGAGREDQRVADGDDAALGLWEGHLVEDVGHAALELRVADVGAVDLRAGHCALGADHEEHGDLPLAVRLAQEGLLVAKPYAAEVVAHDSPDDLLGEPPRGRDLAAADPPHPAGALAVARPTTRASADRSDASDPDAAATLPDAAEPEPAGPEALAVVVA